MCYQNDSNYSKNVYIILEKVAKKQSGYPNKARACKYSRAFHFIESI